jgi:2-oxoglutarate ferredoxin oxidoreductase subunit alpha
MTREADRRVLMEGSHAVAESALQSGCRFYAGYPITPSTEILEYMAARMPAVGGVCMNAESEIEAINMVWGAAGCGVRSMIASTGQGISLMQEAFAEMATAQIPAVTVNMCRGQGDYFQATRGGGHGDYRFVVLAPSTVQEAVDLTAEAFYVADRWRNPVMVFGDFLLSHTTEAVTFSSRDESDLPPKDWALTGARGRPAMTLTSLGGSAKLSTEPGEALAAAARKIPEMRASEARVETGFLDDAEVAVVAFGSPARFVKYAVRLCRERGLKVGYIRPISLWPFPAQAIADAVTRVRALAVFELNAGQMIDDVQLAALGRVPLVPIGGVSHDHSGFGVGPALEPDNIIARITAVYRGEGVAA